MGCSALIPKLNIECCDELFNKPYFRYDYLTIELSKKLIDHEGVNFIFDYTLLSEDEILNLSSFKNVAFITYKK